MNEIIAASYNPILVVLSYCFAVMGSYIALSGVFKLRTFHGAHTSHRIEKIRGLPEVHNILVPSSQIYNATLIVAGIAFGGIGVWVMHFIGQIALNLPMEVRYALPLTLLSLVVAIGSAIWGLNIVARNPYSWPRLLVAGAILGMGVCAMHYLGMYSMHFGGFFQWRWDMVLLSVLIAFGAATTGLWLAFNTESAHARLLAALVMGMAVSAMHYTGMAAADVVCINRAESTLESTRRMIHEVHLPVLLISLLVGIGLTVTLDRMYAPRLQPPGLPKPHP